MTAQTLTRFRIGADEFRHGTLNAVEEFHCVRRIAPLVRTTGSLISILAAKPDDETGEAGKIASLVEGAAPLLQAFSQMTEADADYVITRCMSVTEARQDGEWMPVWDAEAQAPALPHLRMDHVLRISYEVVREAVTVFFSGAASMLAEISAHHRATAL